MIVGRRLRAINPAVMELRRIVSVAMDHIATLKGLSSTNPTSYTVFQIEFYNFLKKAKQLDKIDPQELLTILIRNPNLVNFIKRKKFGDFMNAVRQLTHSQEDREIVFVTLYYEYYYKTRKVSSAILRATKYKLDKFDLKFVKNVFDKYPFLVEQDHLKHVIELLDKHKYSCLLTQNGIKEKYNV